MVVYLLFAKELTMKLKVTDSILCVPPFISTSWDRVAHIESRKDGNEEIILTIHLSDHQLVEIPHLDPAVVDIIFGAHLKHLEKKAQSSKEKPEANKSPVAFLQQLFNMAPDQIQAIPLPFDLGMLGGLENFESAFQHNQEKAETEDLPPEMLEKVVQMAKMMTNGDLQSFPKPEPHCNCMHCQIGRAIHGGVSPKQEEEKHEEVTDEDLTFRSWHVEQTGDQLYQVTSPLDPEERYNVYLGAPIGCTCGVTTCEHIEAVLKS